jgi:hypothetical protein
MKAKLVLFAIFLITFLILVFIVKSKSNTTNKESIGKNNKNSIETSFQSEEAGNNNSNDAETAGQTETSTLLKEMEEIDSLMQDLDNNLQEPEINL